MNGDVRECSVMWCFESSSLMAGVLSFLYNLATVAKLTKFDWKVVVQWATKDSNLVAQQELVVDRHCRGRKWWHLQSRL